MEKKITNTYVKDYYNENLRKLDDEYSQKRWFSSDSRKFDYNQTKNTIQRFLRKMKFNNCLEVGPGDGIWTELLAPKVGNLILLDQSIEMINRAKSRLTNFTNINYQVGDFIQSTYDGKIFDLIFSMRCFEYFEDKDRALKQMNSLLNDGGQIFIVTKNPKYFSSKGKKKSRLHSDQISRKSMTELLIKNNFKVNEVNPVTFRWKSDYFLFRVLFNFLKFIFLNLKLFYVFDFVTTYMTESYVYIATKK